MLSLLQLGQTMDPSLFDERLSKHAVQKLCWQVKTLGLRFGSPSSLENFSIHTFIRESVWSEKFSVKILKEFDTYKLKH
jgi:hypothetical protein